MNKKVIELLEEAVVKHIYKPNRKPEERVELDTKLYNQALALLNQPEPSMKPWDFAILCPDECGGVLEAKGFIDRPICNECGKVFVLCVEPPAPSEFTKKIQQILADEEESGTPLWGPVDTRNALNEACVIIDRLTADKKELQARINKLLGTFRVDRIAQLKTEIEHLKARTQEMYAALDTEHIKQVKELQAEIERLKEENRWIPVSERLPEREDE